MIPVIRDRIYTVNGAIEDEMLEIARTYPKGAVEPGDRRAEKLAHSLSFFPCKGKYFKLASVYRKGKCAGDRLRLWELLQVRSVKKAEKVTCIELLKKRSEINAWRHKDCENLTNTYGEFPGDRACADGEV